MQIHILNFAVIALLSLFTAHSAFAEDEMCPAVYPCLENGELNPIYDMPGFCGDKFRALCAGIKTSQVTDELVSCQSQNENFKSKEERLSKQIKTLRKKLRRKNRK